MSFDGLQWLGGPFPDTEEVTSSNLVTPTTSSQAASQSPDVACFCSNYLDDLERNGHIEQSTRRAYGYLMRYVETFFADVGISAVTPDSLDRFVSYLQQSGLAPGTVRKTYNLLGMCLKHAYATREIEWLPTLAVRAPKNRCPPPNPLTAESVALLQTNLRRLEPTPCVVAARVALHTGMRRGEVCALQWRDVDTKGRTARVVRSIGIKNGGTYVKGTKTGNERAVPIVPELVDVLETRRLVMVGECLERGLEFRPTLYVLGDVFGSYLNPYQLTKWWGMHAREWGLIGTRGKVPTFHDLRHTFATIAVRNVDSKTAQSIMGHSNINMTMRYADTELSQVQAASNALGGAFSMGN